MKRFKISSRIVGVSMLFLAFTSCQDYLDINENPNLPHSENVDATKVLAASQSNAFVTQTINMNQLGNVYMGTWAANVLAFTGGYVNEYQLNVDSNFYANIWNNTYRNVGNFQYIIDNSANDPKLQNYVTIARILKAHYMQYIVDLYGDVPYSQAFKGSSIINPKYDDDKLVYKSLIDELNTAIANINSPDPAAQTVQANQDIIMGGNMTKWLKFANTIKLRMLLRQSKLTDPATVAYVDQELQTLVGKSFVDFNVSINPGYNSSRDDNQNPFYNQYGYDTGGNNNYSFNRAARPLADYLMGVSTIAGTTDANTGVQDPRRTFIYRTGGNIASNVQGGSQGTADIPQSLSGGQYVSAASRLSDFLIPNGLGFSSIPQDRLDAGSSQNGYMMLKAESEFLLAEAAVLYPAKFANAQTHFNNGITASFDFYGIGAQASAYIGSIDSKNALGWTGSTDKIQAICNQRWIALANIHAIETYINYNKYGFPKVPLAIGALKSNRPYRLHYPVSEYTTNSANVPTLTSDDIFTKTPKTPFWLQF